MLPGEVQAAVLPAGVLVSQGPAQAPPSSYEEGEYVLPAHSEKPLSKLNRNPLDDHLKFFERDHIYTYKDVPLSSSVTPLAHSRAAHFDPEAAAALLPTSRSQAYPRAEYVFDLKNGEETWRPDRGALLVAAGKTVAALPPNTMRSCSSVESMREALVACTKKGLVYDGICSCLYLFACDDEGRDRGFLGTQGETREQYGHRRSLAGRMLLQRPSDEMVGRGNEGRARVRT